MVFGRKKQGKTGDEPAAADVEAIEAAEVEEQQAAPVLAAPEPTTGPWDVDDLSEEDATPRVDLGGMRVPGPDGIEMRVEVGPDGNVATAVAVDRGSQLQLNAFAAPRLEGIWDDVRIEIAQSLKGQGGVADEADGPFGRELRARIPGEAPGSTVPARFLGADGPRWFLRGLMIGPAATDPSQAGRLYDVFRDVVVVRGKEAMAPRDPIPLSLPREAQEAAPAARAQLEQQEQPSYAEGDFNPFERGPEITETR